MIIQDRQTAERGVGLPPEDHRAHVLLQSKGYRFSLHGLMWSIAPEQPQHAPRGVHPYGD
jgi:hypothetical protein